MKIQFTNNGLDTLSISDSILTQNGTEWDLDNLSVFTQNEENPTTPPKWYKNSDGMIHGTISVGSAFLISGNKFKDADGKEQICHNHILYFDKDLNGDISVEELTTFINFINDPEEDQRAFIGQRNIELLGEDKFNEYGFDLDTGRMSLKALSESDRIDFLMHGVVL